MPPPPRVAAAPHADFFHNNNSATVSLEALDHVICLTADEEGALYLRVYTVQLKKSGTKLPYIDLTEMGPSMDLTVGIPRSAPRMRCAQVILTLQPGRMSRARAPTQLRRSKEAAPDVMREALKVPKVIKPTVVKNVITDAMGKTVGRVHLGSQDLSKMALKKFKGTTSGPAHTSAPTILTEPARSPCSPPPSPSPVRCALWLGMRKRAAGADADADGAVEERPAKKRAHAADGDSA